MEATASAGNDEEKVQAVSSPSSIVGSEKSNDKKQAMQEQPKMTKTFSWRHLIMPSLFLENVNYYSPMFWDSSLWES